MPVPGIWSRWKFLFAILLVLLAVGLRLPSPPDPEAARPWIRGALAIQGLNLPGDAGDSRADLIVTLPLCIAQNAAYGAARLSGSTAESRGGWIRQHTRLSEAVLWILWLAAAAGAALLTGRRASPGWGVLAGLLVAGVPVGLAGTRRLDGWALAATLSLLVFRPRAPGANPSRGAGRILLPAAIWGAILSLTPLGWVLALLRLLAGRREERLPILLAIPIWFALDPARLMDPAGAVSNLTHGFVFAGWPGIGDGPAGRLLFAAWAPGPVVMVLALWGSWLAVREKDVATACAVPLLWLIPALLGARRPDAVGLIAPLALALSVKGAERLYGLSARGRAAVSLALVLLLAVPVGYGAAREIHGVAERRLGTERLGEILSGQMKKGDLLLRDPAAPSLADSIAAFTLPTYVERPEAWDFAYWPGWYGAFSYCLVRARTLDRIEEDASRRPAGRSLIAALARHADAMLSLGDPATDRSALVLFRLRPGPPWTPAAVLGPWESTQGGRVEARYLADLGGFLAQHGKGSHAIEILRLALKWDDADAKAWNNLGSTLLLMGEAKSAAETFEQGLRRDPSSIELRYNLAKAYLAGNIPGRAAIELKKVLRANPDFAPAHYDLARAAAAEENWPLAIQALDAYLSMNPGAPNRPQIESALAEAKRRLEEERAADASRRLRPAGEP